MRRLIVIVAVLAVMVPGMAASARADGWAIGAKAGTQGLGVELTRSVLPTLNLRLGGYGFTYDYDDDYSGISYDLDLQLFSIAALVDFHPFTKVPIANNLRITGGLVYNNNEADLVAKPTNVGYTINDTTYTAAQVGTLNASMDFNAIAPYLGIGWGQPVGKLVNLSLDLGVMFQGTPDVALTASGPIAANAAFLNDLARERQSLEEDLDNFQFYPVIALGVTISF